MGKSPIELKPLPRENIDRKEKVGECFKRDHHYYLVRENDVLHVGDEIINTLFDNYITTSKDHFNYSKISRTKFNKQLNEVIFKLDFYGNEYKQ